MCPEAQKTLGHLLKAMGDILLSEAGIGGATKEKELYRLLRRIPSEDENGDQARLKD